MTIKVGNRVIIRTLTNTKDQYGIADCMYNVGKIATVSEISNNVGVFFEDHHAVYHINDLELIPDNNPLKNVKVIIVKMVESSGNEQFFCRMVREDAKGIDAVLEHSCFQTKYGAKEECLKQAWFSASFLARWCGFKMLHVELIGFNEEEVEYITKCRSVIDNRK